LELEDFVDRAAEAGIGIYSARILKTGDGYHFEVRLDGLKHPQGAVGLDAVERFSRSLAELIDGAVREKSSGYRLPADLTEHNYTLEVSSAGAERRLRLPHELERFRGQPLRIRFESNGREHVELAVFVERSAENGEVIFLFREYISRTERKRGKKHGRVKKAGLLSESGMLRLRMNQLLDANLYLDF